MKNFSIPTMDFFDVLNEFDKEPDTGGKFSAFYVYKSPTGTTHTSESIMEHGLCYTFNNPPSNFLLNPQLTSEDFKHDYFHLFPLKRSGIEIIPRRSKDPDEFLTVGITMANKNRMNEINNDVEGRILYIHDPYELPSSFSRSTSINAREHIEILIEPQFITIDDSLSNDDISE
jgi:hypothetical protein